MKSFLLIGLGRFGRHMAQVFNDLGQEVMAVDKDEQRIDEALPLVTDARIGDSTNEKFLSTLGVADYDACIVAIGDDFQSSLETTTLIKDMGAKKVIARASRDVHEKLLLQNGADEVIYPEKQLAKWAAVRYSSNNLLEYIELDASHAVFEVTVPPEWVGRSIENIDIRKRYGINVMAVRDGSDMDVVIKPDTVLMAGQSLLVLGDDRSVQRCFHLM